MKRLPRGKPAQIMGARGFQTMYTAEQMRKAVADEREACAMECIKLAHGWARLGAWGENNEFHDCAAAIRARGQA